MSILKYQKKPVVIDAIQLKASNIDIVYEFIYGDKPDLRLSITQDKWYDYCRSVIKNGLDIQTLEDGEDKRAKHVATIGDYIIKGIQGEFYPCKPDIFLATYEPEKTQVINVVTPNSQISKSIKINPNVSIRRG